MIDRNSPGGRVPEATPPAATESYDWEAVREQLDRSSGPEYWRSIEELAGDGKFQEMLHREFPELASEWPGGVSRRHFLQLMSASPGVGKSETAALRAENYAAAAILASKLTRWTGSRWCHLLRAQTVALEFGRQTISRAVLNPFPSGYAETYWNFGFPE